MGRRIAYWIATAGGTGLLPKAPGTFGSLAGLACVFLFKLFPFGDWAGAAALFAVGVWASAITAKAVNRHDPSEVVIDEVCGVAVSLLGVPFNLFTASAGFLLFRFFDIVKPPPIRQCEQAGGGLGIMLDDVAAGVVSNIILRLVLYYGHW